MKLNCDMGESFGCWVMGDDEAVMPWVDMANVACGFHASDPSHMAKTVELALAHGVEVGAHPSYDDKQGFGRRHIPHSPQEITQLVAYQVGALDAVCKLYGVTLAYIKPHGALYNDMMADPSTYDAILSAVSLLNVQRPSALSLMILARADNSQYIVRAMEYNVPLLFEAFADRAYDPSGLLVPRTKNHAVYHDPERIRQQVAELACGWVTTIDGQRLPLHANTICVHGDNEESVMLVKQLSEDLRR